MTCNCAIAEHEMCFDGIITTADTNCACCADTMRETEHAN